MNRWLQLGSIAAALAMGVLLGSLFKEPAPTAVQPTISEVQSSDPMESFRTERQQLRQMQIAQLNELIYGERTDDELVALSQRKLMDLMDWSEQETTLEGVLQTRGFKDALVTVHTDSVNVIVRADSLNRQQTAVILELVMRETGISGGNVKIIPIN